MSACVAKATICVRSDSNRESHEGRSDGAEQLYVREPEVRLVSVVTMIGPPVVPVQGSKPALQVPVNQLYVQTNSADYHRRVETKQVKVQVLGYLDVNVLVILSL